MVNTTNTIPTNFRIKFFLDTMLLSYLIDKTYSGLLKTIYYLKKSQFADLISSNYVIYEYFGIRKREHYFRKIVEKSEGADGDINYGSLLRYEKNFSNPVADFNDVIDDIRTTIASELDKITNDFSITYDNNLLHNKLLNVTKEITLHSKISKEDSLVLCSSIWLDEFTKENFVLLLTNDEQFASNYNETEKLKEILNNFNLPHPLVQDIRCIERDGGRTVNLTDNGDDQYLEDFWLDKLKELMILKNKSFYLGRTIKCGKSENFPKDVVCFRLSKNTNLDNKNYLTLIGKNLDFIYTTNLIITEFWDQTQIRKYPYSSVEEKDLSFKPLDIDDSGKQISIPDEIVKKLRGSGNLVFISPDS